MTDLRFTVERERLTETMVAPQTVLAKEDGTLFIDFGRAAFGTLLVPIPKGCASEKLIVHLGEKLADDGGVDREPGACIRYKRIEQELEPGTTCRLVIPPDQRNTESKAILMPDDVGEVFPFRYAEIENAKGIDGAAVRQVFVHYPFDDDAASFHSSDDTLNAVWDLCKYSIKATTFCGVYVDGDRERIPYEGDAYINQLGHYCVDQEYALARYTHEYMIQKPTWPTEWQLHSVLIAWADYMYTGETTSLATFYDDLCVKSLIELARPDGLVSSGAEACDDAFIKRLHLGERMQDLVDWPPGSFTAGGVGERDNHEMCLINTVVNAFHYQAVMLMSRIADVLGKTEDVERFSKQAALVEQTFNNLLFDNELGAYIDGEGSAHSSLHSNMFALVFGLVPEERKAKVLEFIKSRGMACSVYGAQHLLEAVYLNGADDYGLGLMTAKHDRSWWNMLEAGSTITLEAWDVKYKNNLDWNHAWGAAPANIIPRCLMGIRPLESGFTKTLIQPRPGSLTHAEIKHPTPLGPILVSFATEEGFELKVEIPEGMTAQIDIPYSGRSAKLTLNSRPVNAGRRGNFLSIDVEAGKHAIHAQ